MDPPQARGRIVKLSGLPEVLGNSKIQARVVDATAKRVSRVSQHSPLSPNRPTPQHRISKSSTTSPRQLPQAHSLPQTIRPSPPPPLPPPTPPPPPAEYHLMKSLQHLEIITKRIESMFKMLHEQQLQPPHDPPQSTVRSAQPSPQPQHHFKPSPAPSLTYSRQHHQPSPVRIRQPQHPSPTHFKQPLLPTPVELKSHQHSRVSTQTRQSSRVSPHDNLRYPHHYQSRQTTPVHDITETLADVSISSREYLSRNNLLDADPF